MNVLLVLGAASSALRGLLKLSLLSLCYIFFFYLNNLFYTLTEILLSITEYSNMLTYCKV